MADKGLFALVALVGFRGLVARLVSDHVDGSSEPEKEVKG